MRSLTLDLRTREYVAAAKLRGEATWYILLIEILPNARGPLIVDTALRVGYATFAIGTLGFLGLGLPPPTPDWGSIVKCGIGWGAFTGVTAAELAESGFTGIPSLLGFDKYRTWVEDIGQTFLMVDHVWFKEFACCGYSQTPIAAARSLLQQQPVAPESIAHVRVETDFLAGRLGTRQPATTEEAQFNMAWPLAAYLLEREVGPQQMRDERLRDQTLIDLSQKIELVETEQLNQWAELRLNELPGGKFASRVQITLKDGTRHDSGLVEYFGRNHGLDWDEERMTQKFRRLLQDILPDNQQTELIALVAAFDEVGEVSELIAAVNAAQDVMA